MSETEDRIRTFVASNPGACVACIVTRKGSDVTSECQAEVTNSHDVVVMVDSVLGSLLALARKFGDLNMSATISKFQKSWLDETGAVFQKIEVTKKETH